MERYRLKAGSFEAIVDDTTSVETSGGLTTIKFKNYATGKEATLVTKDDVLIEELHESFDKEYVVETRTHEKQFKLKDDYLRFRYAAEIALRDFQKQIKNSTEYNYIETTSFGVYKTVVYIDAYPKLYPIKEE